MTVEPGSEAGPGGVSLVGEKRRLFCEGAGGFVVVDFKKAFGQKKIKILFLL